MMKKTVAGLCVTLGMAGMVRAGDGAPAVRFGTPRAAGSAPAKPAAGELSLVLPVVPVQSLESKPPELPQPLPAGPAIAPLESSVPPVPELPPNLAKTTSLPQPMPGGTPKSTTIPVNPPVPPVAPSGPISSAGTVPYNSPVPGPMTPYFPQGTVVTQQGAVVSGPVGPQVGTVGPVVGQPTFIGSDIGTSVDGVPFLNGNPLIASRDRFYGNAEFLGFAVKPSHTPVLVTTGPAATSLGVLGAPGTTILLANNDVFPGGRTGGKIGAGIWLGPDQRCAIDVAFLLLNQQTRSNVFSSDGSTVIARPYYSVNSQQQSAEIVAAPGISSGSLGISTTSQFWSAEINFRKKWIECCNYSVDWLVGYRHLNLREGLTITENSSGLPGGQFAGVNGSIVDSFHTGNQFHGAQVGAIFEWRHDRWTFGADTKFALGVNQTRTNILGFNSQSGPNYIPVNVPGGLYALNSNIGSYSQSPFSAVGDLGLHVGYNLTRRWKLTLGYNGIVWTGVQRPGDQVSQSINERQAPILNTQSSLAAGTNAPVYSPHSTTFWAQGVTFGMVFTW